MRRSLMLMRGAVDALDVPILLVGHDRKVEYANSAAHDFLGYPPAHLQGVPVERLLTPERRGEVRNFSDVLRGGSERRLRSALLDYRGQRVDVRMSLTGCRDHGGQLLAVSAQLEALPAGGLRARSTPAPARPSTPSSAPAVPRTQPPETLPEVPAVLTSEVRLTGSGAASPTAALTVRIEQIGERVERLEQLLGAPLHRSRSQALHTLAELRAHVAQARSLVRALEEPAEAHAQAVGAPPPPKLPRF